MILNIQWFKNIDRISRLLKDNGSPSFSRELFICECKCVGVEVDVWTYCNGTHTIALNLSLFFSTALLLNQGKIDYRLWFE